MSLSTGKNNCALILSTTTQQGGRVHEDTFSASFLLSHETERRILNHICSILRSEAHLLHTTCCTVFCRLGCCPSSSSKWTTVPVSNSSLLRWLMRFKTFQQGFFLNLPFSETFHGQSLEQVFMPSSETTTTATIYLSPKQVEKYTTRVVKGVFEHLHAAPPLVWLEK